jgi:hypothetical protein
VEWRWVVVCAVSSFVFPIFFSSFSSSSFSSLLVVFGVVRAQLCEHARYPRTPLRLLSLSSSLVVVCSSSRLSSGLVFLVVGMAVCVYHVSVCSVGMTATGSLSLSSSFFW